MMKYILIILSLVLSGCSLPRMLSGSYSETVATNPTTGAVLLSPVLKRPVILRNYTSKEVAVAKHSADSIKNAKSNNAVVPPIGLIKCESMAVADLIKLDNASRLQYLSNVGACMRDNVLLASTLSASRVAEAALKGDSDVQTIAKVGGDTVQALGRESTAKLRAVTHPLGNIGIAVQVRKGYVSDNETNRDTTIAVAENAGDTTVGDIGLPSSSQSASISGEGASSSSSRSDVVTNTIIIGKDNTNTLATDEAQVFNDTRSTQQVDQEAIGVVNDDVNTDQQPVDSDGNSGNNPNSDNTLL